MTPEQEKQWREGRMRVINIKLDTGKTIMDAKSNKGSEGCLLNALPVVLLKAMIKHIQEIVKFKESGK